MAFDFPNSPTVGQSFTPIAGTTYIWNGYGWDFQAIPAGPTGPAGGPTGPTGPSPGSTGPTGSTGPSVSFPSGSRVLIQAQTIGTAAPYVTFVIGINATYDEYEFQLLDVRNATDAQNLLLQVSDDAGTTWKAGGSDYQSGWYQAFGGTYGANSGANYAGPGTYMTLAHYQPLNANQAIMGWLKFWPNSTARKNFLIDLSAYHPSYGPSSCKGQGQYLGAATPSTPINGVRFFYTSGNLTGTFKLYGIVK